MTSGDAKRRDRDPGVTTGCVGNAFEFRSLDDILNQRAFCPLLKDVDELVDAVPAEANAFAAP